MPERKHLDRIEAKQKIVHRSASYRDYANLRTKPDLQDRLVHLLDLIEAGHIISADYYRKGIGATPDALLANAGIMHLHLAPGSDELLFLVQYDDDVVLLEVNSHSRFEDFPPGKFLRQLHDQKILDKECEIDERRRKEAESAAQLRAPSIDKLRQAANLRRAAEGQTGQADDPADPTKSG